jgi:hypothetical protein
MSDQMVPADPSLRRRAVWLLVAVAVLGAWAITVMSAQLREVRSLATMERWLWSAVGLASGGSVVFGVCLARLAQRVFRTGQYPPPGQRVIRDTPVRRDRAARQLAWLAIGGAGILWAISAGLPLLVWRLHRLLGV